MTCTTPEPFMAPDLSTLPPVHLGRSSCPEDVHTFKPSDSLPAAIRSPEGARCR